MGQFLVVVLGLFFSLFANAQSNSCVDIFAGTGIEASTREQLPPLFRDPEYDENLFGFLATAIDANGAWPVSFRDVKVTSVENLLGDGVAYAKISFKLSGDIYSGTATTYLKINTPAEVKPADLASVMDVRSFVGGDAPLEISPFPDSAYFAGLSAPVTRQIQNDLVDIAIDVMSEIPKNAYAKAGTSKEEVKRHLELQRRTLSVVDSPFDQNGDNTAVWVLRLYFNSVVLVRPTPGA